jgi:hypothetical protein
VNENSREINTVVYEELPAYYLRKDRATHTLHAMRRILADHARGIDASKRGSTIQLIRGFPG